jgi:predicted  nucleic acid-binding Zn-ribbon protein
MSIQETIIGALKASQAAHNRALSTISGLRAEKTALEAEIVRLHAQVASLRSQIAHLEAESAKIVEPASVQTLLAALSQIVEETNQAAGPYREAEPSEGEAMHSDEAALNVNFARPLLRQILNRGSSAQDAAELAR